MREVAVVGQAPFLVRSWKGTSQIPALLKINQFWEEVSYFSREEASSLTLSYSVPGSSPISFPSRTGVCYLLIFGSMLLFHAMLLKPAKVPIS